MKKNVCGLILFSLLALSVAYADGPITLKIELYTRNTSVPDSTDGPPQTADLTLNPDGSAEIQLPAPERKGLGALFAAKPPKPILVQADALKNLGIMLADRNSLRVIDRTNGQKGVGAPQVDKYEHKPRIYLDNNGTSYSVRRVNLAFAVFKSYPPMGKALNFCEFRDSVRWNPIDQLPELFTIPANAKDQSFALPIGRRTDENKSIPLAKIKVMAVDRDGFAYAMLAGDYERIKKGQTVNAHVVKIPLNALVEYSSDTPPEAFTAFSTDLKDLFYRNMFQPVFHDGHWMKERFEAHDFKLFPDKYATMGPQEQVESFLILERGNIVNLGPSPRQRRLTCADASQDLGLVSTGSK